MSFEHDLAWPEADLGRLLEMLSRGSGLQPRNVAAPRPPVSAKPPDSREFRLWMEGAAAWMGIELEPYGVMGHRLEIELREGAPAILYLASAGFLGLLEVRGGHAKLLAPDSSVRGMRLEELPDLLGRERESPYEAELDALLANCGLAGTRRQKARKALMRERLRAARFVIWQLRAPPGSSFTAQARAAGMLPRLLALAGSHFAEYVLWLAAWWVVGESALQGRLDRGWLLAWALLLITIVPFRLLTTWSQGSLSIGCGGLLRQRLLAGALKLDPERIRHEGAGQLLGRVLEAEMLESLALSGGLMAALAGIEAALAAAVLASGAGGWVHVALWIAWLALTGFIAWQYARRRTAWTEARLAMTHDLVERMTGHRTRLTQEPPEEWHTDEDRALEEYMRLSTRLDRVNVLLTGLVPRGWLLVGVAGLVPAFLDAKGSATGLAIGLGGVLLAWQSLRRLAGGAAQLAGAGISWRQVAPLFHAAAIPEEAGAPASVDPGGQTVMEARDVMFRYRDRAEPVLRGVNLNIARGEWLLLEGASGGGKSTLASLIAGLREPGAGLLLSGGLDRKTLGARGWQRRVATAPQYHENHVFTGSFAFNLLMGRHWPPGEADVGEAGEVCRELGLGPLLERMPGGLDQMVGETGWQLSQGERSRLFIARALLQGGDLVVLDESFAALDPENLRQALECVLKRSRTLLVVAHP